MGRARVLAEGAPLTTPGGADSRHCLGYALLATISVVVLPAIVVLPLAPLEGLLDLVVSGVLAIGLSVAAGSIGSALWSRSPESRELVFGDLMLWRLARRRIAARRTARFAAEIADGDRPAGDPLLPALQRLAVELEVRDSFMHGHSERVARHAGRIACQMGLPEQEVEKIERAASVHDVGKLFLPQSILARPGVLSDDEYALVKRHAEQGAELVSELGDPEMTAMVRHHHERVDGAGYPDGLTREEIPLGARIIAVADTFDAITSDRPYRRAASHRSALDVLSEEAGAQLDAGAVSAFLDYYSGKRSIAGAALMATAPQRLVSWLAATPAGVGATAAPIAQGVCAAGAVAIAGVCIGSTPGLSGGSPATDGPNRAGQVAAQSGAVAGGGKNATRGGEGSTDDRRRSARVQRRESAPSLGGGDGFAGQPDGQTPSSSAPGSTGGDTPVSSPDTSQAPSSPTPVQVQPPSLPVKPPPVLNPVIETVEEVLAPAPQPVQDLTNPVKDLLGRTGLTSPAP